MHSLVKLKRSSPGGKPPRHPAGCFIRRLHVLEDIGMSHLISRLRHNEEGAALVEYGILVGLIAVVCIVAVTTVGTQISTLFSNLASQLATI
jgi:pilus assembly protein Flp/PilA